MGDLLYGIHPLYEALIADRRRFERVYVSKHRKSKGVQGLLGLAKQKRIPIEYKEAKFFKSCLGDLVHQGVAAEVGDLAPANKEEMLKRAIQASESPLILALDGIVDPQNLGSLTRTARAMGVHGIVFPKVRAAPLSAATSKASAGAMEHMLFAPVSNLVAALKQFKKSGLWVVGAEAGANISINQADCGVGLVIVIGGEGKGIRPLVRKTCDYLVTIDQHEGVDSLNAAVAGAIVMYEIVRQRRKGINAANGAVESTH